MWMRVFCESHSSFKKQIRGIQWYRFCLIKTSRILSSLLMTLLVLTMGATGIEAVSLIFSIISIVFENHSASNTSLYRYVNGVHTLSI